MQNVDKDHFNHPHPNTNEPTDFAAFSDFLNKHGLDHTLHTRENDDGEETGIIWIEEGAPRVYGQGCAVFHFDENGEFKNLELME